MRSPVRRASRRSEYAIDISTPTSGTFAPCANAGGAARSRVRITTSWRERRIMFGRVTLHYRLQHTEKETDMPTIQRDGATIYFEEHGRGFPILTFAPAGLQSTIAVWSQPSAPINPVTEFSGNFRVIVMDQRNAGGRSRAPITAQDGWHTYTEDHLAVLDHLK